MSATSALTVGTRVVERPLFNRLKVLHVLEATSAGAARFVADILLHHNTDEFDVSFAYSLIRSDQRFLEDLEKIRTRGIKPFEIPMARNIQLGDDLKSLGQLYRLLRTSHFDIVHSHSSKAGFLGRIATKLARKKTVTLYSPHAIAISVNRIYKPIEKFAGFFTDGIVAVSKSEQDQLKSYNLVSPEKVYYVTAAINVKSYSNFPRSPEIREKLGIPREAVLIGTAGRLADQKDPLTFLRIADIVCKRECTAHFLWAGDGELRGHVIEQAKLLGIEDRVHFIGYWPELRPVLASLDIFVLTSRYESFGYVTCEAMALGKPVVATNVDGSNELVRDEETGYLVEVGNAESFGAKLLSLIEDPACRSRFGTAGQLRAEEHYDLTRMVSEIEDLYRSLRHNRN